MILNVEVGGVGHGDRRPPQGPLHPDAAGHARRARESARVAIYLPVERRGSRACRVSPTTRRRRESGVVGLTRSAALGMAKYGVTVNCMLPHRRYAHDAASARGHKKPGHGPAGGRGRRRGIPSPSQHAARMASQRHRVRTRTRSRCIPRRAALRPMTSREPSTPEAIADVYDRSIGQDRLRRLDAMKIPWPPSESSR